MQTINRDGVLGKPEEFNEEKMFEALKNPKVSHVEVFDKKQVESRMAEYKQGKPAIKTIDLEVKDRNMEQAKKHKSKIDKRKRRMKTKMSKVSKRR